jgi:hypothetical protein
VDLGLGEDMRTFAHHDSAGNILSIVAVDAPEGVEVMLQPAPGVFVTELDVGELALDPENIDDAQGFIDQYKVAVPPAQPRTPVRRE